MISLDTTRKDHLGFHGGLDLTPNLDAIASDALVMQQHVQCSNWTIGSGTCSLRGRYNPELGRVPWLGWETPEDDPHPTLASVLSEAGWHTILSTGNDYMSPMQVSATGYDEWKFFAMGSNSCLLYTSDAADE